MTTGDPLVVRGAMKPLPTLTKPLRSVDIATKEPAQALRERTDSCTVPPPAWWRVDGRARAGDGLPREVRRRPHRRRASPRQAPTASGSDGGGRPAAVDRRGPGAAARGALVLVGFMGAGKTSAARSLAARLDAPAARLRPRARARARRADRGVLRPRGRGRVPRARGGGRARALLARERRPRGRARAAARSRPSACARRSRAHTVVHLEVDPGDAWRRASGKGRPLARDRGRFKELHEQRRAGLRVGRRRDRCRRASAALPLRALPALLALAGAPAGTRLVWADRGVGRLPGLLRARPDRVRLLPSRATGAGSWSPTRTWRAHHRVDGRRRGRDPRRRGGEEPCRAPSGCCARWPPRGSAHEDLVVAVGGGVVGDLAGFCAAVYQRGIRHVQVPTTLVAQVDSAYGGKTGVDLPGGQELRGRLPPAVGRARRSRGARDAARARSSPPATPRW